MREQPHGSEHGMSVGSVTGARSRRMARSIREAGSAWALAWVILAWLGGCAPMDVDMDSGSRVVRRDAATVETAPSTPTYDAGGTTPPWVSDASTGYDASTGAPGTPSTPGSSEGIPCEVERVLAARCRNCHGAPARFGAPMSLVTLADLRAPSPINPSQTMLQRVVARIRDDAQPMPPAFAGTLSAAEKSALDAWAAAGGAPGAACGGSGDAGAPRTDGGTATPDAATPGGGSPGGVGPDALPCTPSHRFVAHAAGSMAKYNVPVIPNLYQCFAFRSPFTPTQQATAWAPIIDNERVIHHWILFRTRTPQAEGSTMGCRMPLDSTFVAGWAPGGPNYVMPPDVGMELSAGANEYFILQVHYNNTGGMALDSSGVAFCTTNMPRPNVAGVLSLGSASISIPPRTMNRAVTGNCMNRFGVPLTVLSSTPHMHQAARSFRTEILRGGATGRSEMLVDVPRWNFNDQTSYQHSPPVVVNPGDVLRTTCTYDNTGSSFIRFGERTEDEMCFNFALVYPVNRITGSRYCLPLL
jgi:hypothetical protein